MFTASYLVAALCGILLAAPSFTDARHMSRQQLQRRRTEAAERFELRRRAKHTDVPGVKNITFTNPKASRRLLSLCTC